MINLKKQTRVRRTVPNIPHRNIFFRRPVTRIRNLNRLRSPLIIMRLRLRHAKVRKTVFLHRQLLLPSIVNHNHRHLIIRADKLRNPSLMFFFNTPVTKTRNILQRLIFLTFIRHRIVHPRNRNPVKKLHHRLYFCARHSILLHNPKHIPILISFFRNRVKLQHKARCRHNVLIAMFLIRPVISRKIHLHQLKTLLNLSLPHPFLWKHPIRLPAEILRIKRRTRKMKHLQLLLLRHPKHNLNPIHIITDQLRLNRSFNSVRPFLHVQTLLQNNFFVSPAYDLSPSKSTPFLLFSPVFPQQSHADLPYGQIQTLSWYHHQPYGRNHGRMRSICRRLRKT